MKIFKHGNGYQGQYCKKCGKQIYGSMICQYCGTIQRSAREHEQYKLKPCLTLIKGGKG